MAVNMAKRRYGTASPSTTKLRKALHLRVVSGLGSLRPKQFLQFINTPISGFRRKNSIISFITFFLLGASTLLPTNFFPFFDSLKLFQNSIRKRKMVTLEDLRGDSPALCGSFNKIREEIRAVAKNKDEEDEMLTERILIDLIKFSRKKRSAVSLDCDNEKGLEEEKEKKKKRVRVIPPKNPLNFEPKNSNQSTREEGKCRKPERQVKKPAEEKPTVEEQPPSMPTEFKDKIMGLHGRDVKLVIQKKLTTTDMEDSQDRLSIPRGQMRAYFLTQEEEAKLEEKEEDGIHLKGLKVALIEPSLKESAIFLKKWKLGSGSTYMLSSPWKNVANKNGLKKGNIVQLWSFRVDHNPCLALIKLQN
ncbi:B3 domain-containing protein At3g25182-like [Corylus avellana]|uniref:B3 domain-containing protein At3g25182-like n=1 Tax=Corylus avellana TaxID=13451 RepID=UPI00286BDF6E|nr:B3 domain-containing protein At3g25182-like [Corylus avellana]